MPSKAKTTEEQVTKMMAGLSLKEVENLFHSPSFRKLWKDLSADVKKNITIKTNVQGTRDVEDLVEALDAAAGASEEFFKKIDKYRSTTAAMNLAFKEGAGHMREYLQQAERTGGKLAVVGAATTYLLKGMADTIKSFDDIVAASRRYNVEQEKFRKTSAFSAKEINGLRRSLSLTKEEMGEFFRILDTAEMQGFGSEEIEKLFKNLRSVYGNDAMNMMKEYQEILSKMPLMRMRIQIDPSSDITSDEIGELLLGGRFESYLQLKAGGAFGGKVQASKEAEKENVSKDLLKAQETIKDIMASGITKEMTQFAWVVSNGTKMLEETAKVAGAAGGIKEILKTLTPKLIAGAAENAAGNIVGSTVGSAVGTSVVRNAAAAGGSGIGTSIASVLMAPVVLAGIFAATGGVLAKLSFSKFLGKNGNLGYNPVGKDLLKTYSSLEGWKGHYGKGLLWGRGPEEIAFDKSDSSNARSGKDYTKIFNNKKLQKDNEAIKFFANIAEAMKEIENRPDMMQETKKKASEAKMFMAETMESQNDFFEGIKEYQESLKTTYDESIKLYNEQIKKAKEKQFGYKVGDVAYKAAQEVIDEGERKKQGATQKYFREAQSVPEFNIVTKELSRLNSVLSATSDYVKAVDGSFTSMLPIWEKQLDVTKKEVANAKVILDLQAKQPGGKETEEYKRKETDYAVKILNMKKAELDMALQIRNTKLEEINFSSQWISDQADFLSEMGGYFGDVISMRAKSIEKERESISVLEEYLTKTDLTGQERLKGEVELERKKMDLTRKTIGVQKDAYEKFIGLAFGQLNDVGFKRGRMDASVLLGTDKTRTKNQAGMYIGEGIGLNRDQMTGLTASGYNSNDSVIEYPQSPLLTDNKTKAMRAVEMNAPDKQNVNVQATVKIETTPDFKATVTQILEEKMNDQSFAKNLIERWDLLTTNKAAKGGAR